MENSSGKGDARNAPLSLKRYSYMEHNTYYYIVMEGHVARVLFYESKDYKYFLRTLKAYKHGHNVMVFGYCLLPRVIHLVVQGHQEDQIKSFIRRLRQTYLAYVTMKYSLKDEFWHQYYKKMTIDNLADLMACLKSVEFSPVNAFIVDNPLKYPWCSCNYRTLSQDSRMNRAEPLKAEAFISYF